MEIALAFMFGLFIESAWKLVKNRREDEDERWAAWKASL